VYEMITESIRITATEVDQSLNIKLTLSHRGPVASVIKIIFSAE